MGERTPHVQDADFNEVVAMLSQVIAERKSADVQESYTASLLQGKLDKPLQKLVEEATEVALAAKDNDHDHIRYEAADLFYHLLVVLERCGVTLSELAGELLARHK
ncbi:MAG: phosphoribosyl-ATP diphosphatase [Eggerthellaceae bacterium]|nr:phosphoribosyl-ATP diphosphatase [Eggerthellaceae bacterium]